MLPEQCARGRPHALRGTGHHRLVPHSATKLSTHPQRSFIFIFLCVFCSHAARTPIPSGDFFLFWLQVVCSNKEARTRLAFFLLL